MRGGRDGKREGRVIGKGGKKRGEREKGNEDNKGKEKKGKDNICTLSTAPISAPASSKAFTACPQSFCAASIKGVRPSCENESIKISEKHIVQCMM